MLFSRCLKSAASSLSTSSDFSQSYSVLRVTLYLSATELAEAQFSLCEQTFMLALPKEPVTPSFKVHAFPTMMRLTMTL